jgi:hypothetical protein
MGVKVDEPGNERVVSCVDDVCGKWEQSPGDDGLDSLPFNMHVHVSSVLIAHSIEESTHLNNVGLRGPLA